MKKRMAKHGTISRYYNAPGCRCDRCRKAAREYTRGLRAKLRATPYEDIPHGTVNGYQNYGCRCEKCVRAQLSSKGRRVPRKRRAVAVA